MGWKMGALLIASLLFAPSASAQDTTGDHPLAQFGLKPAIVVTAAHGKASFPGGGAIELVGALDLSDPLGQVWDAEGHLVDRPRSELFWKILDDRPPQEEGETNLDKRSGEQYVREVFGKDKDGRTFAMAFRLTGGPTTANDFRTDVNRTFLPNALGIRTVQGTGDAAYVGVARIVKPILPKDSKDSTFDFRLEVPGGEWTKIVDFPFGPEDKLLDGKITAMMRYQNLSDFKTVNGVEQIVDYKGYYFTFTLPIELRDAELEIVTNDPPEDAKLLPPVLTQHIPGEEQGKEFAGMDLFLVYGLRSHSATRTFTLRARPKRIVEFRSIPFKK